MGQGKKKDFPYMIIVEDRRQVCGDSIFEYLKFLQ